MAGARGICIADGVLTGRTKERRLAQALVDTSSISTTSAVTTTGKTVGGGTKRGLAVNTAVTSIALARVCHDVALSKTPAIGNASIGNDAFAFSARQSASTFAYALSIAGPLPAAESASSTRIFRVIVDGAVRTRPHGVAHARREPGGYALHALAVHAALARGNCLSAVLTLITQVTLACTRDAHAMSTACTGAC